MWLAGAIARGDAPADAEGTFDTLNLIVAGNAADAEPVVLYQSGPSGGIRRDARGSFVAQMVAAVDLDGDGVDELLVRARHYAGGNLKVLKWNGSRYREVWQSGYEGE
jgi:FG-GAP repeat